MGKNKAQYPDIKTIANAAGVSTATVSRALNHHPYVSDELRSRILFTAKSLGYAPSVSTRRNLFGILVGDESEYSFSSYLNQVLSKVSHTFFADGYNVQLFSRNMFPYIFRSTFCGVIVFSEKDAEFFCKVKIPCVVINEPSEITWSVCSDHAESLRLAVEYLLNLHHKRIAYIGSDNTRWGSTTRKNSYFASLRNAGIEPQKKLFADFYRPQEDIPLAIEKVLKQKPTALIVEGEGAGIIANHSLQEKRIRVPQDLSLITFESKDCSCFLSPPQTTVCQDFEELGICAARTLIQISLHPARSKQIPRLQIVHNHIIERQSCRDLS